MSSFLLRTGCLMFNRSGILFLLFKQIKPTKVIINNTIRPTQVIISIFEIEQNLLSTVIGGCVVFCSIIVLLIDVELLFGVIIIREDPEVSSVKL